MSKRKSRPPADAYEEVPALIEKLLETERRLEELTGGEVDTVADRGGRTLLLRGAQEQLRHSESAKQAAILNALPAHICLLDAQGLIISVNGSWRRFDDGNEMRAPVYGVGLSYLEICDRAQGDGSSMAHQAAQGIRSVLGGLEKSFSIEYPCHSTTEQRWFLLTAIPLSDDRPNGAVVMHLNITEQKRAKDELRESERRFSDMLDNVDLVSRMLDRDGRITYCNDYLLRLTGWEREEVIGRDWFELFIPSDRHDAKDNFSALLAGLPAPSHHENEILTRSGGRRLIRWNNTTLRSAAGEVVGTASIGDDITDRKRAERQMQELKRLEYVAAESDAANRAKSMFLSHMTHEIRTPMNAILGYSQLLLRDPGLGADAKANLKIINRSGEHLLSLIDDVLDMSKIEAGRTEINPTTFSLSGLLDDLGNMFRLRAEAKALRFEILGAGELMPYVTADAGKIRQALINLLGNAIKFTERGQIKMQVNLDRREANRLWLSARVEDTGVGVTDAEQKKLFQPFTQTKEGLNTHQGTGLGLAISRQHARLMGGDITVASGPGGGSIFQLEVPVEPSDAGGVVRTSAPRRVIGIRAGTIVPRILVVDDQFENRDWLMKLLDSVGFSVRGADDGEAAIRTWEEWDPRLILMDVQMPVMDGLEATRRIKADPRGKETVIAVLTASAMDDDRRAVSQSGADDFLTKPCREGELLEKLRTLLNIAYDYEETGEAEGKHPAGVAALSAERLGQLPRQLLEELRMATLGGKKRQLDELIHKVRETQDAGSAEALQELADIYEYDALTQLLEQAAAKKGSLPCLKATS